MRKRKHSEWKSLTRAVGEFGRSRSNTGTDALMLNPWSSTSWTIKPSNISIYTPINNKGQRPIEQTLAGRLGLNASTRFNKHGLTLLRLGTLILLGSSAALAVVLGALLLR